MKSEASERGNATNDGGGDTRKLRVDVGGDGELEEVPLFLRSESGQLGSSRLTARPTHHEILGRNPLGESSLDDGVHEDDLGELDGDVVFVAARRRARSASASRIASSLELT